MTMAHVADKGLKLSSGHKMPLLGFGTWQNTDKEDNASEKALDAGYRHIDTAFMYFNENLIGRDIKNFLAKNKNVKREDIFVTTKLPMNCMAPEHVERSLKSSLKNLGLDYVDLYLVHSPLGTKNTGDDKVVVPMTKDGQIDMDYGTDIIAIWKTMESMVAKGLTKSIGVSNYSVGQLRKTIANAKIKPAVHQIELHLRYQRPEMLEFCKENDIVVTSYSSLGSPGRTGVGFSKPKFPHILEDPVVRLVAENHSVSSAQVALKFWVQQNVIVIPKSSNAERIKTNGRLFGWELTDTEMAALKSLDKGKDGKSFIMHAPAMMKHPEYHD